MEMSMSKRVLVVAAVAVLGGAGLMAQAPDEGAAARAGERRARSFRADGTRQLRGGLVRPSKEVVLKAPLDGIIRQVLVEESDAVSEGDVLAQMDDVMQQLIVERQRVEAESEASILSAEAQREDAQIRFDKATELEADDVATAFEVRRAGLRLSQAEAELTRAKEGQDLAGKTLELEQEKLARYAVKAPFDGRIVRVVAESGASVTRDDTILSMVALDPLEAQLFMPLDLFGEVKVGKRYRLIAGPPVDRTITGVLKTIDPIVESASSTFRCVFTIENAGSELPAGFKVVFDGPE